MSYLEFDKKELVNLEYSLSRETIRTNRGGSFASTTIVGCNTRKYHGLLVCPIDNLDGQRYVLLSSLDATLIQQDTKFQLGIHKYPGGHYYPKGHMYVKDFETEPIPKLTYRIGNTLFTKEILLVQEEEKILIRYTLQESQTPAKLQLQPFLAFRNIHELTRANMEVNSGFTEVKNGIKVCIYDGFPDLFMQCSKKAEFVPAPDWHYNIEYPEEQKRGYTYQEDLFVPGYFELDMKKGENIIFSAALKEISVTNLKKLFAGQLKKRIPRNSFENCLINSAQQFLVKKGEKTELIAGYPWFGKWGRDTFIALSGITLAIGDVKSCKSVLDTMTEELNGALFANSGIAQHKKYNSVDASLWYFWTIQQYSKELKSKANLWKSYGSAMKAILKGYKEGMQYNIKMQPDGLIYAGKEGEVLTWMDSSIDGKAVTPRIGCPVEVNSLWYNALMFSLELAGIAKDKEFIKEWETLPVQVAQAFVNAFWNKDKGYLADYVNGAFRDWAVRPNQIFATSLPYSPLTEDMKSSIIEVVESELLTPKGLRTLSPRHPDYKGIYEGCPAQRDAAYHQGTVWVWLLGHFCEAYLNLYGKEGAVLIQKIYKGFEEDMRVHGVGSISEVYDGNPPYRPNGAISQAWSVGELLRIRKMLEMYKK